MLEIMTNPIVSSVASNPNPAESFDASGGKFDQQGLSKMQQGEELNKLPDAEKTLEDLRRFLGSPFFRQVGPVIARRVVSTFGVCAPEVIENTPDKLTEINGIGKCRLKSIKRGWTAQGRLKDACDKLRLLN